jgi:hypothetical protein
MAGRDLFYDPKIHQSYVEKGLHRTYLVKCDDNAVLEHLGIAR